MLPPEKGKYAVVVLNRLPQVWLISVHDFQAFAAKFGGELKGVFDTREEASKIVKAIIDSNPPSLGFGRPLATT
jgi:hypothetical protein